MMNVGRAQPVDARDGVELQDLIAAEKVVAAKIAST